MEATYRKFEEWGQFDRYCKLVLYHEAIDYLRELQRLRDNEVSLEVCKCLISRRLSSDRQK